MEQYIVNPNANLSVLRGMQMQSDHITNALHSTHDVLRKLEDFDVNIAELLGMRNLSAFAGEVFAAAMVKAFGGVFRKNPHQDGYPDLLLMDKKSLSHWDTLKKDQLRDKTPFSPFATGGVEVKATCGSVPDDKGCRRLGYEGKPIIGDQRIKLLRSYDWKAHHQQTNLLLGIVWDFIDGHLRIVGVFYSNELSTVSGNKNPHWGAIIQPKEGGGRTTSVSIMTRAGVRKMYESWILVLNDNNYIEFFDRYNRGSLMNDAKKQHIQPVAL